MDAVAVLFFPNWLVWISSVFPDSLSLKRLMVIWQEKFFYLSFNKFFLFLSARHLINTKVDKWATEFMSKRQIKCNSLWEKDHLWLQKCKNGQFASYCLICKRNFSVNGGRICLVKQHEKIKIHISRTEELCNQLTF